MTTTAKIAAKGCNGTGITEDLAQTLHNTLGRTIVAVVELVAETRSEKRNGDETVVLSINTIEPAPTGATVEHLRELARSFYYERQLADGQLRIETGDGPEPTVSDVLAAGAQHRPHDFLSGSLALDEAQVCDICGQHADAAIHQPAARIANPFTVPDDEDLEDTDDAEDEDEDDLDDDGDGDEDDDPTPDEQWQTTQPDDVNHTDDTQPVPTR